MKLAGLCLGCQYCESVEEHHSLQVVCHHTSFKRATTRILEKSVRDTLVTGESDEISNSIREEEMFQKLMRRSTPSWCGGYKKSALDIHSRSELIRQFEFARSLKDIIRAIDLIAQLPENSADYAYSEQETLHIEFLADPDGLKIMLDGRTLDGDVVPESSSVFAYDDEEALRMAIIKVQTAFKRMLRRQS